MPGAQADSRWKTKNRTVKSPRNFRSVKDITRPAWTSGNLSDPQAIVTNRAGTRWQVVHETSRPRAAQLQSVAQFLTVANSLASPHENSGACVAMNISKAHFRGPLRSRHLRPLRQR